MKKQNWMQAFIAIILMLATLLGSNAAHALETIVYYEWAPDGSPIAATDESGNLLWRESYRPYGERLKKQDGGTNDLWFTGKPQDEVSGLVYMGKRYYDPVMGRFTGIDPQGFVENNPHSFNRYAYANNNPYKYVDPDGRSPLLIFVAPMAAGWVIGGTANAVTQYVMTGHIQWGGVGGVFDAASDGAMFGLVGMGATGRTAVNTQIRMMNPNSIRFSQDSIKANFRDQQLGTIDDLAAGLKNGSIKSERIEPIRLVEREGHLISIDNRRLEAFRRAGVKVPTRMATSTEIQQANQQGKFSAGKSGATTIRVRGE